MITSTVPATGSSAAVPGYRVCSSNQVQATVISSNPTQPATAAGILGSRDHIAADSAITPPAANSHARVGSEKNAHEGSVPVQLSAVAKENAATIRTTIRYGSGAAAPVRCRRGHHAVAAISTGQSR